MILDSVNKSIRVVLSVVVGSTQLPFFVSWVDETSTTLVGGSADGATNGTTAVEMVPAPNASTRRQVKSILIFNDDINPATVTVDLLNSATSRKIIQVKLEVDECLQYEWGAGWRVIATNGAVKSTNSSGSDWEYLGGLMLNSAAVTTGVLTIAARSLLSIRVRVTGYSASDIAALRFNGDTGSNYWSRYIHSVAGGVVLTNNQNVSQTLARLFALTTTLGRSAEVSLTNYTSNTKIGAVRGQTGTAAAGTAAGIEFGGFEWVNTAAQITSVEMRTAGGANTLSPGSGFGVWGRTIP